MVKNQCRRWLITGGCGFIGIALVKQLIKNRLASSIRVVDNLSVGTPKALSDLAKIREIQHLPSQAMKDNGAVDLITGDVKDLETACAAARGADIIVHLAANTGVQSSIDYPLEDMETNVIGNINYLEAARRNNVSRFVFSSSGAPMGRAKPPVHEEMACHPLSPYGASKMSGEAYCSAYHGSFGLKTIALRISNIYGPGSKHKTSVVAKLINQALNGQTWMINGNGKQTRDFLYIDDLINAILKASVCEKGGEILQIASQRETTINKLVNLLSKIIETKMGFQPTIKNAPPLQGELIRNFADISKAKSVLNWSPVWNLNQGLSETVKYFCKKERINREYESSYFHPIGDSCHPNIQPG